MGARSLEEQGHWGSQYDELAITSRKQHCQLPHYTLDLGHTCDKGREPADETMTVAEFVAYLRRFAARFQLGLLACRCPLSLCARAREHLSAVVSKLVSLWVRL